MVAPHAGAWIETLFSRECHDCKKVAPHAGAWIETAFRAKQWSGAIVAPHAGAWIETPFPPLFCVGQYGRAPRGRVD